MVSDDDEVVAKQILAPLLEGRGYCKQLTHIGGRVEEFFWKWLTEESQGMALLRQKNSNTHVEGVCLHGEQKVKVRES